MPSFRSIFHDSTWKLMRVVGTLLVLGIALTLADIYLVPKLSSSAVLSSILQELSTSVIGAAILVLIVDVGFRQEILDDIQNIFRSSQSHLFVDQTFPSRHELLIPLVTDVQKAIRGDRIDTAGVVEVACTRFG